MELGRNGKTIGQRRQHYALIETALVTVVDRHTNGRNDELLSL